jgi:hypothetical protein
VTDLERGVVIVLWCGALTREYIDPFHIEQAFDRKDGTDDRGE